MQLITPKLRPVLHTALVCLAMSACSGSGSGTQDETDIQPGIQLDATAPDLGPDIAVINRPAGTDLVIAYSDPALQDAISVDYIQTEWENMKACLATSTRAPYVVLIEGFLESMDSDDVLFNFEGRRLASATWKRDQVNVIRVSSFDFDGSQGNAGFHLRSIIGRYLWILSDLPVRDYNTLCASGS